MTTVQVIVQLLCRILDSGCMWLLYQAGCVMQAPVFQDLRPACSVTALAIIAGPAWSGV